MAEPEERARERASLQQSIDILEGWISHLEPKATFREPKEELSRARDFLNDARNHLNRGDNEQAKNTLNNCRHHLRNASNYLQRVEGRDEYVWGLYLWDEIVSLSNEIERLRSFSLTEGDRRKLMEAESQLEIATENLTKNDIDGATGPVKKTKTLITGVTPRALPPPTRLALPPGKPAVPRQRVIPLGSEAGKAPLPTSGEIIPGQPPQRRALPRPPPWPPRRTEYLEKTKKPTERVPGYEYEEGVPILPKKEERAEEPPKRIAITEFPEGVLGRGAEIEGGGRPPPEGRPERREDRVLGRGAEIEG
ncbi:MAG: hypothetical protein AABW61_00905 [Candidatus Aenigmatarchaeota archaeon]